MPVISGTVFDASGNPVAGRIVRAYRRDTGELLGWTLSSDGTSDGTSDPHWANVVALLHFDDPNNAVKTEKGAAWYIHKTGSGFGEVTQSAAKFGMAGLKLNSPSRENYYYPSTDGVILTGEIFTAEVFCMPRKPSPHVFTSFFGQGDSDQQLAFNANGKIWFYRGRNALGGRLEGVGFNQYPLNTYYHIAMTFDGTHIRVFVDGNKEIEIATATGWTGYSNTRFGLGDTDIEVYNYSYRQATDVYFDELRITKGVARYTANFTPPTEPFPNRKEPLPLGKYEIETNYTGECNVICLDDSDGTTYNDLILRTIPA